MEIFLGGGIILILGLSVAYPHRQTDTQIEEKEKRIILLKKMVPKREKVRSAFTNSFFSSALYPHSTINLRFLIADYVSCLQILLKCKSIARNYLSFCKFSSLLFDHDRLDFPKDKKLSEFSSPLARNHRAENGWWRRFWGKGGSDLLCVGGWGVAECDGTQNV